MVQYSSIEYWDERYQKDDDFFDWYQPWEGFRDTVEKYMKKDDHILILGCGLSKLSEDIYNEGYTNQMNIDISSVAINKMKDIYQDKPSMKFAVMNVLDLSELASGSFEVILDKGTLDTILCGDNSVQNVNKMIKEIIRLLKPGGVYICITYGKPSFRLPYLELPEYNWKVESWSVNRPHLLEEVLRNIGEERSYHYIFACFKD